MIYFELFSQEIYPPRISEFAYVTDKAYYEGDILDMELDVMRYTNKISSEAHKFVMLNIKDGR